MRSMWCEECEGTGKVALTDGCKLTCGQCDGAGYIEWERSSFGRSAIAWVITVFVVLAVAGAIWKGWV